ncbi:MAG: hypothetical protein K8L91_24000 [Anaerolineae bacterium]|nr:hypothetical protein [Anaerolineae bacterium]
MLRKSQLSRPLLVIIALLMAALACYSDDPDPLGIFEFTPAPPTSTPLPPPDANNPAKFVLSDLLLCPRPAGGGASQCFVTDNPEELSPGVTNARGSCEYDTELEVLYIGRLNPDTVYYLIACGGTVGWINEGRLMGPVVFPRGESALTTSLGADGDVFPIASQKPPTPGPQVSCKINEVVEVLESAGDPLSGQVWNLIRCSSGAGWVEQERLFGPLPLPGTGGLGMIRPDVETVTLTNAAAAPTADNQIGECAPSSVITTNNIERVGNTAFYNINCGDLQGWVEDQYLVEILYRPDSLVLIEVPALPEPEATDATTEAEGETPEDGATTTDGTGEDATPEVVILTAPMTENPEFATEDNVIGECPTDTIVRLKQTALVSEEFFYQIECAEKTGWVFEDYVLTGVKFFVGTEVVISERGFIGNGPSAGFYIKDEPSYLGSDRGSLGACKPNTTAQVGAVGIDPDATGTGVTIYYQITCVNADETSETPELTGWAQQDRLFTAEELQSEPATNGLIGG